MVFWFSKIWFPADFPVNPGNEPNEQQLKFCLDYKGLNWICFVGECGKGTRMIAIYSYLGVPQVWTMPNEAQCVYTCVEHTMMICVKNTNNLFDLCKTSFTPRFSHGLQAWLNSMAHAAGRRFWWGGTPLVFRTAHFFHGLVSKVLVEIQMKIMLKLNRNTILKTKCFHSISQHWILVTTHWLVD